jgi:WD40 repeat protein
VSTVNVVKEQDTEYLLSGGSDLTVNVCKTDGSKVHTFKVEAAPRSLDMINGTILIGLENGTIQTTPLKQGETQDLIKSHEEGECWGLTPLPGCLMYITSADDNKLLLYDIKTHKVIG